MTIATADMWIGSASTASAVVVGEGLRDPEQAYFFTTRWQTYVARAEDDIVHGRIAEFATTEELFADLEG